MLRHVGIVVRDVATCREFYYKLGFTHARCSYERGNFIEKALHVKNVEIEIVKLSNTDGDIIELLRVNTSQHGVVKHSRIISPGISHIALTVSEIDPVHNPQTSPDGKVKVAFISDPEGNMIELVEEL